jgi:hypothetical protein
VWTLKLRRAFGWCPQRFSIRALLALTLLVSVGLGWWLRPIYVEEPWGAGYGLTIQYHVRRGWNGDRYYVGPATIRYENGKASVIGYVDGLKEKSVAFGSDDGHSKFWHEDGRELNGTGWFFYMSQDYLPRQMNGEPISTEEQWRPEAAKFRKDHPEFERNDVIRKDGSR